jgi:hypothetical protein
MHTIGSHSKSFSLTSPGLGVECAVVVVGEYYYSHKTKSIEKRDAKRKRGGAIQDTTERNIKWKAFPNPKDNVIQTTSILNDFVGANSMSVYEMAEALDIAKLIITELEDSIDTIKNTISDEFRKEAMEVELVHKEETQRQLQLQEKELAAEFEKRVRINQKIHQNEMEKLKITHAQ